MVFSFIGGGNQSNCRKPLTCRKSMTNFEFTTSVVIVVVNPTTIPSRPHVEWYLTISAIHCIHDRTNKG
jgi:hypothetical protein